MTTRPLHTTARGTLAERYVHAATRRLPEDQRADVAEELRASIADRADALVEGRPGISREEAEHAALVELGDPARLAADYSGQVNHLIGAEVYPAWLQSMKAVMVVAVPCATVGVAVARALTGASFGGVVGGAAWTAFTVTVHVAFWITLAFAIVERSGAAADVRRSVDGAWEPGDLPELPRTDRGSVPDLVTNLVWLALVGSAVVWQQVRSPIRDDGGERLPLLDPDLWSSWLPLVLALLVVEAGYEVVRYRAGGWSPRLAAANVVLGAAFAAPLVYLAATERLLNPEAVAVIREDWSGFDGGTVSIVVLISVLVVWLWDGVDGWRKARA